MESIVGCYYCTKQYPSDEIEEFVDGEKTAICPKCGIDSVVSFEGALEKLSDLMFRVTDDRLDPHTLHALEDTASSIAMKLDLLEVPGSWKAFLGIAFDQLKEEHKKRVNDGNTNAKSG